MASQMVGGNETDVAGGAGMMLGDCVEPPPLSVSAAPFTLEESSEAAPTAGRRDAVHGLIG